MSTDIILVLPVVAVTVAGLWLYSAKWRAARSAEDAEKLNSGEWDIIYHNQYTQYKYIPALERLAKIEAKAAARKKCKEYLEDPKNFSVDEIVKIKTILQDLSN